MKKVALLVILLTLVLSFAALKPVTAINLDKAVYLINGSLGDNSFYDSGQAGMDILKNEYGMDTRTIECGFDAGQYEPSLEAAVHFADLIFVISYGFEDILAEYADEYPEKVFVNLDTVVENEAKTIINVDYIEEESAFLAGIVAALVTTSDEIPNVNPEKLIGAVGGDTDPVVDSFIFAYANGAKYIDPEIKNETKYLGDWVDSAKGKQAALQLYDLGADVVFQVAAAAGMGVLQASGERNLYSIGVDTNQNSLVPGHVVASDIKDIGMSILNVYKSIADGSYTPGETLNYGLESKAVDVVFEENNDVLPQSIIDKVSEVRDLIISGELEVERYVAE